jgi:hypothetical protein
MSSSAIKSELEAKLNSATWNTLKANLLGKELIEFAATVVSLSQSYKDSLRNSYYVDGADLKGLILFCASKAISFDVNSKTTVKIEVGTVPTTAPLKSYLKSGSVFFYNLDYLVGNKSNVFVQGSVKTFYTELLTDYDVEKSILYSYFDTEKESIYYKLGIAAVSSSVLVYKKLSDNSVILMSEYDPLRESENAEMYKLYRGYDGSLNVYFGNGVWAKSYDPSCDYQIVWLEGSNVDFDVTTLTLVYGTTQGSYTTLSSSNGKASDIEYSRSQVKAEIAKRSVIATVPQIEAFINSIDYILDCRVDITNASTNVITVYVKPINVEDYYFDEIVDVLNLRGEIVVNWKVLPTTQVRYNVRLIQINTVSVSVKSAVESLLAEKLSYENTGYNDGISPSTISNLIYSLTSGNVVARTEFSEYFLSFTGTRSLSMRPVRGTVKIYKNSVLEGWDNESVLFYAYGSAKIELAGILKIGDFFFQTNDKVVSYNSTWTHSAENTGYIPITGAKKVLLDSGYALIEKDTSIVELEVTDSFYDTDVSIQRNPNTYVFPLRETSLVLSLDKAFYVYNVGLFTIELSGNQYFLYKRSLLSLGTKVPNFVVEVSDPNWTWVGASRVGSDLIVIFREGASYVENFVSPTSRKMLDVSEISASLQLSEVVDLDMKNSVTVLTKSVVGANYVYTVWRSSGFSVDGTLNKVLVLNDALANVYSVQLSVNADFRILESTTEGAIVYLNNSVISVGKYTKQNEDSIKLIEKVGTVDFSEGEVFLGTNNLQQVTFLYDSADDMSVLDISKTPVLGTILWE